MKLIPSVQYEIQTRLAPQEVCGLLRANTGDAVNVFGKELFTGSVQRDSFRLIARQGGRNGFRPVLYGTIREGGGGSVVRVEAKLKPFARVFCIVWLCFVGLFLLAGITGTPAMLLNALFVLVPFLAIVHLAFRFAEKEARRRLTDLLK